MVRAWRWAKRAALAAMAGVVIGGAAQAQSGPPGMPSGDPVLRIETGRHAAAVTHLAVDGAQRLLATASLDKTVRLWDLASGTQVGTLRVPIGSGAEGSLYSVALSPDGKTLLTTGYTGSSWDGSFSLYLFDVEQRKLKTRLAKLPELVNDVAFSPDGGAFAAVFSGRNGLAVWNSANGKMLGQDRDYGDIATSLSFDRSGRLATASFDGFVRLYGPDYALRGKAKMPAGSKLHAVVFSPDSQFLAVGYEDSLWVDVLTAADLKPAFRVDLRGIEGGNLAAVGWVPTASGFDLIASGTARDKTGGVILRRWANGGKGAFRDTVVGRDTVAHLLGGLQGAVFASADPAWGVVDQAGKVGPRVDGQIADFRDIHRGRFAVSANGQTVEYGVAQGGMQPFRFDIAKRELQANPPKDAGLLGPADQAAGIAVSDWRNTAQPKVNGQTVSLQPQELARSATVVAGTARALIGTDDHLRLIDASGRELAQVQLPAAAWGVVASADHRLAVAALGDGTLRWYSLLDNELLEELVSYFPSGDGRRWIAWSREGFFGHSENGGADLAGYHLNKGTKTSPEWVEFAQLYQLYYAPELLPLKLARNGEAVIKAKLAKIGSTAKLLNEHPAPQVDLVEYCPQVLADASRGFARVQAAGAAAPAATGEAGCPAIVANLTRGFARADKTAAVAVAASDAAAPTPIYLAALPPGMNAVKLRFRVTGRQGGIGDVDVFVNGKVVSNTRGFARVKDAAATDAAGAAAGPVMERVLPLTAGRNLIYVRAYDRGNGVETRSSAVELTVALPERGQEAAAKPAKPKMYVLGAGVDRYKPPYALRYAVKDMTDVVATIKGNKSDSYSEMDVTTLTDEQASLGGLSKAFDRLAKDVTPKDTVIIYLAGHGYIDDEVQERPYYFITQDVDNQNIANTAFSQGMIKEKITALPSKNIFLFLDTCHSGKMDESNFSRVNNYFGQIYILAAASSDETALDSYKGINGPFAFAVLDGLKGKAARGNVVNDHDLGAYVKKRVPELVGEVNPNHKQSANFKMAGGEIDDFELAQVGK